jgi:hypothetical protein
MNENFKWGAAAVAVVGLSVGAVVYFSYRDKDAPPPAKPAVVAAPVPVEEPPEPAVKNPLPPADSQAPLPKLEDSDQPMANSLEEVLGKEAIERFVIPKDLIRHIVVTVDNLAAEKVAERIRPVKRTPGSFVVSGTEDAPVLDPTNFARYDAAVALVRTADTKQLVAVYKHYYPRFQEVYESLGHPPEYFNDRLIEVIDDLLAAPDLQGPVALARPNVLYEYADPKLESRSAGQKAMMRMGSANAKVVMDKLRELRGELATQKPAR